MKSTRVTREFDVGQLSVFISWDKKGLEDARLVRRGEHYFDAHITREELAVLIKLFDAVQTMTADMES